MMMKRILPWALLGGGVFAYMNLFERLNLELVETEVLVSAQRLPTDGLRILLLSDLHLIGKGAIQQRKIERTWQLLADRPIDLVLITGDFWEHTEALDSVLHFVSCLPHAKYGIFGCLGNHDYWEYSLPGIVVEAYRSAESNSLQAGYTKTRQLIDALLHDKPLRLGVKQNDVDLLTKKLSEYGVTVLVNQSMQITPWLWMSGLDDVMEGSADFQTPFQSMPTEGLRILLAHHPDSIFDPLVQKVDLAFSGHVHGGQIRLPLLGARYTQGAHLPPNKTSGWFYYGNAQHYISRGWGESTPLRFLCRPEITLVHVLGQ